MKRIVIAGSRKFNNLDLVTSWLEKQDAANVTIVTGGASGVDERAEDVCNKLKIPVEVFYAEWGTLGKAAGPIRNEAMVKDANAVVVFWDGESRGTRSTINLALRYKKPLEVIF